MAREETHVVDPLKMPAAETCKLFELSAPASKLVDDRISAKSLLKTLHEQGLNVDAIRLAAYNLPRRDAIWWGCLCVWQAERPEVSGEAQVALQAVVSWVRRPGEETRRAAEEAGKKLPANDAVAGLCQAVFLSGGSISKPKLPEVPPAPHLCAKRVASVVVGISRGFKDSAACQKRFVELALEVSDGKLGHEPTKNK